MLDSPCKMEDDLEAFLEEGQKGWKKTKDDFREMHFENISLAKECVKVGKIIYASYVCLSRMHFNMWNIFSSADFMKKKFFQIRKWWSGCRFLLMMRHMSSPLLRFIFFFFLSRVFVLNVTSMNGSTSWILPGNVYINLHYLPLVLLFIKLL